MNNSKTNRSLFKEFDPISTEQWEDVIKQDLKGADYSKKLIWNTLEGIPVRPYYRAEDLANLPETGNPGSFPFTRGSSDNNNWLIRQDIAFEDATKTAEVVNKLIENGIQSIGLSFGEDPEKESLIDFLNAVSLEAIEISYKGIDGKFLIHVLDDYCTQNGLSKTSISGSMGIDPIGAFILSGNLDNIEEHFDALASVIHLATDFPNLRVFEIDAKVFHNSGSDSVQELAYGCSVAVEYLDELSNRGIDLEVLVAKATFNFAIGRNYFFELAKFRAARTLWAQILKAYLERDPERISFIHAETSRWNTTAYDPYVNLLRTTTEAMSSILGGIDSLTILPFDISFRQSTEFSTRLARNQQILLKEEAYLNKVVDPAAGSYYIENLTHSLIEAAWSEFNEIEELGGFIDAFLKGKIQDSIVTMAEERDMRLAQRREVLLGTNHYPNFSERILENIDKDYVSPGIEGPAEADAQPLIPYRGAEGFEALRLATEKAGRQPVVFLLSVGNINMRKARATFALNFFGCAGYRIIDNNGFASVEEGMEKAIQAEADIVVLCSSDEEYAQFGPEAANCIGNAKLVIAGYPVEIIDQLHEAGISHFIHVKTNVLETLKGFNQLLGIS